MGKRFHGFSLQYLGAFDQADTGGERYHRHHDALHRGGQGRRQSQT